MRKVDSALTKVDSALTSIIKRIRNFAPVSSDFQLVVYSFYMGKETTIILVVVGLAIFVWLPVIVVSVLRVLRRDKKNEKNNNE